MLSCLRSSAVVSVMSLSGSGAPLRAAMRHCLILHPLFSFTFQWDMKEEKKKHLLLHRISNSEDKSTIKEARILQNFIYTISKNSKNKLYFIENNIMLISILKLFFNSMINWEIIDQRNTVLILRCMSYNSCWLQRVCVSLFFLIVSLEWNKIILRLNLGKCLVFVTNFGLLQAKWVIR